MPASQSPLGVASHVPTRAPSTRRTPLPTVTVPAGSHLPKIHPGGRLEPENSWPTVGARITSPLPVSDTYVLGTQFWPFRSHVSADVPARKSTDAVSCSVGPGTVRLGANATAAFPEWSIEVSRR